MVRVSVVIPVRDDAELLRTALRALAAQTRPADEIVVVDNGSSDDSADVARAGGARVVTEPVPGIPRATATGFDAARGDVLARIDADSVPGPDWLARIDAAFTADPGLTGLTGPGRFYGGGRLARALGRALYIGGYFRWMTLALGHPPLFGSDFALRADAWRTIRPRVHSGVRFVHDDLDISFQLEPGMRVDYDPAIAVAISARPFSDWAGFLRRLRWAFQTIALNWREEGPIRRRLRRYLAAPEPAPTSTGLRRLVEEGEKVSAQLIWRGLARAVARPVHGDARAELLGEAPMEP